MPERAYEQDEEPIWQQSLLRSKGVSISDLPPPP